MPHPEVTDNPALHRFELQVDGATAFVLYQRTEGPIRLIHTEVPAALRGKGVASRLTAGVLQFVQKNGLEVVPLCPFVLDYLKRHLQYLDAVDEKHKYLVLDQQNSI